MTEELNIPTPENREDREFEAYVSRIPDVRGVMHLLYSEVPGEGIYLADTKEHGDGFDEDAAKSHALTVRGVAYVGYPARRLIQVIQAYLHAHGYGGTVQDVLFTSGPDVGPDDEPDDEPDGNFDEADKVY